MAKRRLSQRQRARIHAIQQRRLKAAEARRQDQQAAPSEDDSETREGQIIANHGPTQWVEDIHGEVRRCVPRQTLGAILVSGDRVLWRTASNAEGVITALQPRKNVLSRRYAGGENRPLAANVDHMLVVAAPTPPLDEGLIDRYLVAAECLGIEPTLIVNKTDRLNAAARSSLEARTRTYTDIGYRVLYLSAKSGEQAAAFRALLPGRANILTGQSGVGKSSLVQTLLPDRDIRIGALSEITGLGAHTTSTTMLYHLPGGGDLIDSPGVRNFAMGALTPADVEYGYREFRALSGRCKFKDCRHQAEPGCAVQASVEAGLNDPGRFRRMVEMRAEAERREHREWATNVL